ncbi:MAG: hypothetical protein J6P74_07900 [Paludibacteraceae bacterium]|nr:hypothetical protein [Paludibacteraceae bacterium]
MIREKIAVWYRKIWRSDFGSNLTISLICFLLAIGIWWLISYCYECDRTETFKSLLKSGSSELVPDGLHISLGIVGAILIAPFAIALAISIIRILPERIGLGLRRYHCIKGHFIILGYNQYSISVILNLLQKERDNTSSLIILTTYPTKTLRAELKSLLPKSVEERIIIYSGSPQSKEHIGQLRLQYAKSVYITLEGNEWDSAYTRSMSILPTIAHCTKARTVNNLLPVNILINDDKAYDIAQTLKLPDSFNHFNGKQNLDIHVYNFYENWARLLWSYKGLKDPTGNYVYNPLDFEPLDSCEKFVHLVVVGYNSMGKALVNEAIRVCHYPNYDAKTKKGKTLITIIDPQGDSYKRCFEASYPRINEQVRDIDIEFINAPIEDANVRNNISKWAKDKKQLLTIAICIADPDAAMQMALNLPEEVYCQYKVLKLDYDHKKNRAKVNENNSRTRVLVRQTVRNTIQELADVNSKHYANLKIFGFYQDGLNLEILDDTIAICVNGLYWQGYDKEIEKMAEIEEWNVKEKIIDWQRKWYNSSLTSMENQQKTRYQIDIYRSVFAYLKDNSINLDEGKVVVDKRLIEQLADVEHRRFMADVTLLGYRQKVNEEWRVDDVKIHNCIDDYNKLSNEDQLKDHVVIKACPVLKKWERILL